MAGISKILVSKGKEILGNSLHQIVNETKALAIENVMNLAENSVSNLTEQAVNFFHKQNNSVPQKNEIEEILLDTSQQASKIVPQSSQEDNPTYKEYARIVKKKVIEGKIPSSSNYFLKLERERLKISDEVGDEIEERILASCHNQLL